MGIAWNIARVLIASITIVIVAELSKRFPRYGALLISLPILSILAFSLSWFQHHDLPAISKMARETLVLVPLTLLFFVPFAFAERWGLGFWSAFLGGLLFASAAVVIWFWLAPRVLLAIAHAAVASRSPSKTGMKDLVKELRPDRTLFETVVGSRDRRRRMQLAFQ
jgi:hypothetical protein